MRSGRQLANNMFVMRGISFSESCWNFVRDDRRATVHPSSPTPLSISEPPPAAKGTGGLMVVVQSVAAGKITGKPMGAGCSARDKAFFIKLLLSQIPVTVYEKTDEQILQRRMPALLAEA